MRLVKISTPIRVAGVVGLGMLAMFLGLWAVAVASGPEWIIQDGVELRRWEYYQGTFRWFSAMMIVVGVVWVKTPDSPNDSRGNRARFGSLRLYRCAFVALPFFGLGTVIGKSMDSFDRFVGLSSLIVALGILAAFLLDDIWGWFFRKKETNGVA